MLEDPATSSPRQPSISHRPVTSRRWLLILLAAGGIAVIVGSIWLRSIGPASHYRQGRAALLTGDRDGVLAESEYLVRVPGYEPHGWLLKGLLLSRLGKLDEAIIYFAKATEHKALAVEANTAAAQCFYQSNLYLQAIDAAQSALKQDETCLDARRWLASAYYDLGAVSHAVNELERISVEAPRDPRPGRLLGLIAKDGESYTRAIDYYRDSLGRDPHQPEAERVMTELAECQIRLNQFDEALVTLRDCVRSAEVMTLEADCFSSLGRFEEADSRLNDALKTDPRYFPAKLALGKLHLDQGRVEEAVNILTEATRLNPHVSQGHFQLSQALRRLGKVEQADQELNRMQQTQALEREFSDLHVAAAKEPNDAEIRFRTGELALRLGKPGLAQVWFRAALAVDPNHARARAALNQHGNSKPPGASQAVIEADVAEQVASNPGYIGPQACTDCHAGRVAEFQTTRHFQANRIPSAEIMPDGFQPGQGEFLHPEAPLRFEMTNVNGHFVHSVSHASGAKRHPATSEIAFVYGAAGGNDEVYFTWHGDKQLRELPIVWLAPQKRWGSSPLDRHGSGDFSREMTVRCVECHNTWADHVTGSRNQYRHDSFIMGVTCEVCHGPGREHVGFHREHPEVKEPHAVVRPAQLSRERRMDLCAQCHSNAIKHRGPAFQYRPGLPLDDFYVTLRTSHPEEDHVANQTTYLRQSKCFQSSETLTCVTCHNPHQPRSASNAGAESCRQCHADGDCADHNNLPLAVQNDCIGCHMPRHRKIQVFFRTEDDQYVAPVERYEHKIGIYPRARQSVLLKWHHTQTDAKSRDEVTALSAKLSQAWMEECDKCQQEHRFLAAIDACREALDVLPRTDTQERLQSLIRTQSKIDAAIQDAQWHEKEGRYPQAIAAFQSVLELKPDSALALAKLGTTLAVTGENLLAIQHLKSAARYAPDDPYAPAMLGWLAYLDARFDDAMEFYRQAEQVEPYSAKINYQMGLALARLDRMPDAIEHFSKAITIEPENANALLELSRSLRHVGKSDEALRYGLRAARLSRFEDPEILLNLADANADAGNWAYAVQLAEQALAAAAKQHPQLQPKIRIRLDELRTRLRK